ncbi:saccharopine dehydrogenase family protein [Acidobacteriota bacterium]
MRALVLGCGEMGSSAVEDLYHNGELDEIIVGTRSTAKVRGLLESLKGRDTRIVPEEIEVDDAAALADLMRRADVVINCVGPNYKYEVKIAEAAISAKKNLVDINDDFETTFQMLDLDEAAKEAGITIILGMGASPGVNNILVRAAANQLDRVERIHTAWIMSGADPGGLALSYHLLYSLSHKALTFQDGKFIEVQSFVDGKERIEFPEPVGEMDVFHIGHPEPITLSRCFEGVRYVDDKASFNPPSVNDLILDLGRMVREAEGPIKIGKALVDPMDFAASYFQQKCRSLKDVPKDGGLRIRVDGLQGTEKKSVYFSSSARIAQGTGIPASIGAIMLLNGHVDQRGVCPPEECIDPNLFIYESINRRNVAKLNGWVE